MANDSFRIPGQVGERPLQDALRVADSFQYSPEKQAEPFRFIKDIEDRIHSYREAALEADHNHNRGILNAFGWYRKRLTVADLIEMESQIGGELFGKGSGMRLWLDHKGSSAYVTQNNIGDWYHTRPVYLENGRVGEIALHYESRPSQFSKLYNGVPYALSVEELEQVCHAIQMYENAIREKLYPLDDSLHDLQEEIDQEEHIVIPETNEKMFSREAVQRMIEEYKTKRALEEETQRIQQEHLRTQQLFANRQQNTQVDDQDERRFAA